MNAGLILVTVAWDSSVPLARAKRNTSHPQGGKGAASRTTGVHTEAGHAFYLESPPRQIIESSRFPRERKEAKTVGVWVTGGPVGTVIPAP